MNEKKYINRPLWSIILSLKVRCPKVDEEYSYTSDDDDDQEQKQQQDNCQAEVGTGTGDTVAASTRTVDADKDAKEPDSKRPKLAEEQPEKEIEQDSKMGKAEEENASTTDADTATEEKTVVTTNVSQETNAQQPQPQRRHQHHPAQCQWEGPLSEYLERHSTKECPFLKQQCPRCQSLVQLVNLENHLTLICPYRMVTCPQCMRQVGAHELQVHLHQNCPHKEITCPHCLEHMYLKDFGSESYDSILQRKTYRGHMEVCPMLYVDCEFASHGCPARMPRKDKDEHERDFIQEHAKLLNHSLKRSQHDRLWQDITICWEFPANRVASLAAAPLPAAPPAAAASDNQQNNGSNTIGRGVESQRVYHRDFVVFTKLQVDFGQHNHNDNHNDNNNNVVQVVICVENPKYPPLIDRVNINLCDVPGHYQVQCPLLSQPERMTREDFHNADANANNNAVVYTYTSNLHLCPPAEKNRHARECSLSALQKVFDYSKLDALVLDMEFRLRYENIYRVGCYN